MSIVKADALIIKGFRYGDSSKIITVFSREYGKFNALVKSTRSIKSKTSGVFDGLNRISVFFNRKENRDLQFFSKGDCINSHPEIKSDLSKLSMAYRIAELLNYSTHDYDTNEELFELTLECMSALEESIHENLACMVYFQANLTKLLGIKPELVEENPIYISETFKSLNALKLSKIECETVNAFFDRRMELSGADGVNYEHISDKFDGYLSGHLDKPINFKTKNILHELNF
jgi:DNA repair protein RecO